MKREPLIGVVIVFLLQVDATGGTINVPGDFQQIQAAIEAAQPGDEILVGPGEYPESIDFLGKAIALRSTDGPASTTISGSPAVPAAASGSTVVFRSGEGRETLLQGFTITGGTGTAVTGGEGVEGVVGGGILVMNGSSPTIQGNVITENDPVAGADDTTLGGGIAILEKSSPLVEANEISRNEAQLGGGVAMAASASPELRDNEIEGNGAEFGGGILVGEDSSALLVANRFKGNHALWGAGMYVQTGTSSVGGAPPETRVVGGEFAANEAATAGAGLCAYKSSVVVERCVFLRNSVPFSMEGGWGGGIYADASNVRIASCWLIRNDAYYGGGAYLQGLGSQVIAEHLTFFENAGTCGGGMALASKAKPQASIRSSIFWDNGGGGICGDSGNLMGADPSSVRYCDFSDGLYVGENGNFSADPLFEDAGGGNLHLKEGSPCIDAGFPVELPTEDLDIDGEPRVVDGNGDGSPIPDVGADEYLPLGQKLFVRSDANADGSVDISDPVTILTHLFLGSPSQLDCRKSADVDDLGSVEITDAIYLLTYLFIGGKAPKAPFPGCGIDPTEDPLTCVSFTPCE